MTNLSVLVEPSHTMASSNKVYKILSYTDGTINAEDFTSSAVFNVKYGAKTCIPIENTKIVVRIEKKKKVKIKKI